MSRSLSSLTVRELIEVLENEDPNAIVIFSADYGDYHHTQQALPLTGDVEEVEIYEERGYSNSGFAIVKNDSDRDEADDDGESDVDAQTFLVLR